MEKLLERILDWLEKNVPLLLLAFGAGKRSGESERIELEKKLLEAEVKAKKQAHINDIKKKYADIPDTSIVDEIARRGKK